MSNRNVPANGDFNGEDDDFEIIDENQIEFVKRGRKAIADPILIEKIKALPKGSALVIRKMQVDPKADNYANEKARIASQIRTAIRSANRTGMSIKWRPDGVPQVIA